MGNYCCPDKDESSQQKQQASQNSSKQNQTWKEYILNGVSISIKIGDITTESADGIVSGTDNFVKNRSGSFLSEDMVEILNSEVAKQQASNNLNAMRNGQVVMTQGSQLFQNCKFIFHISIPLWRGGKYSELEILQNGFEKVFELGKQNNIQSILFSDVGSYLFGIPKQLSSQALIQAIKGYQSKFQQSKQQLIKVKFIHRDKYTIDIFEDVLRKELGIRSDRSESIYEDMLQGSILQYEITNEQNNGRQLKEQLLSKHINEITINRSTTNDTL